MELPGGSHRRLLTAARRTGAPEAHRAEISSATPLGFDSLLCFARLLNDGSRLAV